MTSAPGRSRASGAHRRFLIPVITATILSGLCIAVVSWPPLQAQEPVPLPLTPAELPGIPPTLDGDWHWRGAGREGVLRFEGLSAVLIHGDGTAAPFARPAYDITTGRVWFDLDDGAMVATGRVFGGVMQGTMLWREFPPTRTADWCASRVPGCEPGRPLPDPSPIERESDDTNAAQADPDPTPVPADTTQLAVQVGSRRLAAGDTCWVPIWVVGANKLDRLSFLIAFPPDVLTATAVPVAGSAAPPPPGLFSASTLSPGVLHVALDRMGGFSGTGIVAQIPLKAIGLSGTRAPLDIRVVAAGDSDGRALGVTATGGLLRIVSNVSAAADSPLAGDADGDGLITVADALVAIRMANRAQPSRLAADANADGYVTIEDATLLVTRVATTLGAARVSSMGTTPASAPRPYAAAFTVGSGRAVPGADALLPVTVASPTAMGAVQCELSFDPAAAQIQSVTAGAGWPGAVLEWRVAAPGRLHVAATGADAALPQGELFVIHARLAKAGPPASRVAMVGGRAWDHTSGFEMVLQATPGDFTRDAWAWTPARLVITIGAVLALLAAAGLIGWAVVRSRRAARERDARGVSDRTTTLCAKCGTASPVGAHTCTGCGARL